MCIQEYCDSEQTFFQKFKLNKKLYIIYALMMFNTFSHTLIKCLNLNECKDLYYYQNVFRDLTQRSHSKTVFKFNLYNSRSLFLNFFFKLLLSLESQSLESRYS